MIQLTAKPERTTVQPTMQSQAPTPVCLLTKPKLEPPQLTQYQTQPAHSSVSSLVASLELATHAPLVVNLTIDTHRVSYDYTTKIYAEITRSGRVYKPATPATKPSCSKPILLQPVNHPSKPITEETPVKPTSTTTKKDLPSVDIIIQLKKVKVDIFIWDLIHTSSEHRWHSLEYSKLPMYSPQ